MRAGSGAALAALVAAVAALASAGDRAPAPASAAGLMTLSARSDAPGRITIAVSDPGATTADVGEQVAGRTTALGRIALAGGAGELGGAVAWRCDRRSRRFTATSTHADGSVERATATIVTPSCARRLHVSVVPAQVRPGQAAIVHVADSWRLGGISGRLCARSHGVATRCLTVRPPAKRPAVARMTLPRAGRWTIALRTSEGQTLARTVRATARARFRLLVSGDSMTYGVFETLRYVLGDRAQVRGDPHLATGISMPAAFDWPAHARSIARAARADVTVVILGAADGGFPLPTAGGGAPAPCCGRAWIAEYARRVAGMMRSYLRGGRSLLYWVILPAPSSPSRATVFTAINAAIRVAAASFDDGVYDDRPHREDRLAGRGLPRFDHLQGQAARGPRAGRRAPRADRHPHRDVDGPAAAARRRPAALKLSARAARARSPRRSSDAYA